MRRHGFWLLILFLSPALNAHSHRPLPLQPHTPVEPATQQVEDNVIGNFLRALALADPQTLVQISQRQSEAAIDDLVKLNIAFAKRRSGSDEPLLSREPGVIKHLSKLQRNLQLFTATLFAHQPAFKAHYIRSRLKLHQGNDELFYFKFNITKEEVNKGLSGGRWRRWFGRQSQLSPGVDIKFGNAVQAVIALEQSLLAPFDFAQCRAIFKKKK